VGIVEAVLIFVVATLSLAVVARGVRADELVTNGRLSAVVSKSVFKSRLNGKSGL